MRMRSHADAVCGCGRMRIEVMTAEKICKPSQVKKLELGGFRWKGVFSTFSRVWTSKIRFTRYWDETKCSNIHFCIKNMFLHLTNIHEHFTSMSGRLDRNISKFRGKIQYFLVVFLDIGTNCYMLVRCSQNARRCSQHAKSCSSCKIKHSSILSCSLIVFSRVSTWEKIYIVFCVENVHIMPFFGNVLFWFVGLGS